MYDINQYTTGSMDGAHAQCYRCLFVWIIDIFCFRIATVRINFLTKTQKASYAATASPSKTSDRTRTSNEVFLHPNAVTTPYKHMPIDSRFNHPSIKKSCAFNFYCRLRLLLLLSQRRCRAQYLCSYFASTTPTSRHDHHIILTKPIKHV